LLALTPTLSPAGRGRQIAHHLALPGALR
jgi:hypothetical protein